LEKLSSLAKATRIKYLEEMVVKEGFDPNNSKSMEEIVRKKNANIATLLGTGPLGVNFGLKTQVLGQKA